MLKAEVIGHLGRDPEMRYNDSELAIASFSVASSKKVKGEDKTQWVKIIAFGKLAEVCGQYLTKGKQIFVEGDLQSSEWQDKDGNKRFSIEIVANRIEFLSGKSDSQKQETSAASEQTKQPAKTGDDDPIPF